MRPGSRPTPFIVFLLFCIAALATRAGLAMAADSSCPDRVPNVAILHAFRLKPGVSLQTPEQRAAALKKEAMPAVGLGDTVVLEADDLKSLTDYAECRHKPLVLSLNDRPIAELVASPALDPSKNLIRFDLKLSEDNRKDWVYHLGEPRLDGRLVRVSVAPTGEPALPSTAVLTLVPVRKGLLLGWFVGFAVLLASFIYFARNSNVIRASASELAPNINGRPQYSLSRVQAAWWFFVVMAAFILIGIVTGDFETSLNSTALSLLGIGAGTAVASATIDASSGSSDAAAQRAKLAAAQRDIDRANILATADVSQTEKAALKQSVETSTAQMDKLLGVSRGFLIDIVSDASGVVFHRFQVVAWTVVLTVVFITDVYRDLAMPEFSNTLLGLQGLSVLTYLGLKIPEDKPLK